MVIPKKRKCNKSELEERTERFKLLRNKHSAVESDINKLATGVYTDVQTVDLSILKVIFVWVPVLIICIK
jgi:hypothetical protein